MEFLLFKKSIKVLKSSKNKKYKIIIDKTLTTKRNTTKSYKLFELLGATSKDTLYLILAYCSLPLIKMISMWSKSFRCKCLEFILRVYTINLRGDRCVADVWRDKVYNISLDHSTFEYGKQFRKISHLNVFEGNIVREDLKYIIDYPNLTSLCMDYSLDDSEVKIICKMRHFIKLELNIKNEVSLERITAMPSLTHLRVMCEYDSRYNIKSLSNCKSLTSLNLCSLKIMDKGVESINNLPLKFLDISDNQLTWTGGIHISAITTLTTLIIGQLNFGSNCVSGEFISTLPLLRVLDISSNEIGDEGAEYLSRVTTLVDLKICNNHITSLGAKHLWRCSSITSLNLFMNSVCDDGLLQLATMPSLDSLDIECNEVTAKGLARFVRCTPFLTHLRCSKSEKCGYLTKAIDFNPRLKCEFC